MQLYQSKTVAAALTRGDLVWRDQDCVNAGPRRLRVNWEAWSASDEMPWEVLLQVPQVREVMALARKASAEYKQDNSGYDAKKRDHNKGPGENNPRIMPHWASAAVPQTVSYTHLTLPTILRV